MAAARSRARANRVTEPRAALVFIVVGLHSARFPGLHDSTGPPARKFLPACKSRICDREVVALVLLPYSLPCCAIQDHSSDAERGPHSPSSHALSFPLPRRP